MVAIAEQGRKAIGVTKIKQHERLGWREGFARLLSILRLSKYLIHGSAWPDEG